MNPRAGSDAAEAFLTYLNASISEEVHPDDQMKSPAVDAYMSVGRSAVRALTSLYLATGAPLPKRILDFGCGHGRVTRHIRAWVPDAVIHAGDVLEGGVKFTSDRFRCEPLDLPYTFGAKELPKVDLVWVGSVFTHVDYRRMKQLAAWLWQSVAPGGMLVATFHGERARQLRNAGAMPKLRPEMWDRLQNGLQSQGHSYESYGVPELGDWGVSYVDLERLVALGSGLLNARTVGLVEYGWAGLQDVGAWQRHAPLEPKREG